MKRTWTIIAVADVVKSAAWYGRLRAAHNTHAGATVFDQIVDDDGEVLLCLHWWGPSGVNGNHHWPSLEDRRFGGHRRSDARARDGRARGHVGAGAARLPCQPCCGTERVNRPRRAPVDERTKTDASDALYLDSLYRQGV
jgi:hypothetical protein